MSTNEDSLKRLEKMSENVKTTEGVQAVVFHIESWQKLLIEEASQFVDSSGKKKFEKRLSHYLICTMNLIGRLYALHFGTGEYDDLKIDEKEEEDKE